MTRFAAIALAALFLSASAPYAAAQNPQEPRLSTLALTGEGKVFARPDLATVTVGVTAQSKNAKDAIAENSRLIGAVIAAAKEAGVEPRDLQTARVSLNPQYTDPKQTPREARKIVAYEAVNTLTIRVRDLEKLGGLLDRLVVSGANNIRGVALSVAKPEPLLDKARAAALKDALRKAELYAEAGNLKIVRVLEINETGANIPYAQVRRFAAEPAAAPRPDVPVEAGEQQFHANVSVIFEIAPK